MDGVIQIAVDGARLIYELTEEEKKRHPEMNIRFEYSPESFTGTEMDNAGRDLPPGDGGAAYYQGETPLS